jgi:hypothetical protein
MLKNLRYGVVAVAAIAMAFFGPASQAGVELDAHADDAHATSVVDVEASELPAAAAQEGPSILAWPTPNRRTYTITSSCAPYASAIRRGAAAWSGLTEGGGTPVECRNSYITDCGSGGRIVGCNWGRGQRIALYMGGVNDDALLAAHEFGHDWFGHSTYRCAGWGSAAEVMAPSICNLKGSPAAVG